MFRNRANSHYLVQFLRSSAGACEKHSRFSSRIRHAPSIGIAYRYTRLHVKSRFGEDNVGWRPACRRRKLMRCEPFVDNEAILLALSHHFRNRHNIWFGVGDMKCAFPNAQPTRLWRWWVQLSDSEEDAWISWAHSRRLFLGSTERGRSPSCPQSDLAFYRWKWPASNSPGGSRTR